MAQIKLRNKTINIDEMLYEDMKKRLFDWDEQDCIEFLRIALTKGTLTTGLTCPDLESFISSKNENELSALVARGAELQKSVMKAVLK